VKIVTIVGARPQFIKAAPVSRALREHNCSTEVAKDIIEETLIHTGQHYDYGMSGTFFETLDLKTPKYNLGVGSGSHGTQLAKMIKGLEEVLTIEQPDLALLYGDTNSTLAGALIADRLHIPIAHVEAGLRSFNRRMAEECNRMIADRLAELLFAPTRTAVENLEREGITRGVYEVGDVMREAAILQVKVAQSESTILERLGLTRESYSLATVHRAENTDDPVRLSEIVRGLVDASRTQIIVWPLHPRTRKQLSFVPEGTPSLEHLLLTDPIGYHDMLMLEKSASVILTDSGGVQKEAFWFGVPCVTLRDETEWVETVQSGRNKLVGSCSDQIREAFEAALRKPRTPLDADEPGTSPSDLIVRHLRNFLRSDTESF
jgi:UDP-N-acetylglucosamine 2-epimerase